MPPNKSYWCSQANLRNVKCSYTKQPIKVNVIPYWMTFGLLKWNIRLQNKKKTNRQDFDCRRDILCLFWINATYLPVRPFTVNCTSTAHCTHLAMLNLTALQCMHGSEIILAWPMTAAGDKDPKAGRPKM